VLIDFYDKMELLPKPPLQGEVSPQNTVKICNTALNAVTEGFRI